MLFLVVPVAYLTVTLRFPFMKLKGWNKIRWSYYLNDQGWNAKSDTTEKSYDPVILKIYPGLSLFRPVPCSYPEIFSIPWFGLC